MKDDPRNQLTSLAKRYSRIRLIEILISSTGVGLIALSMLRGILENPFSLVVSAVLAGIVFTIQSRRFGIWTSSEHKIAAYLNQHFPELQSSADLWTSKQVDPTTLQLLQKARVEPALQAVLQKLKLPNQLPAALLIFAMGILGYVFLPISSASSKKITSREETVNAATKTPGAAKVDSVKLVLTPPAYTKQPTLTQNSLSLKIREGTEVAWRITFTEPVEHPMLVVSGKDSASFANNKEAFELNRVFHESGFYQLQWTSLGATHQSDFYPIEIINDEPPQISVQGIGQFTEVKPNDPWQVSVTAQLQDDYGVTNAYIIGTVSKGSGESVKFREEKLLFTQPARFTQKIENASRTIDLKKLGLEVGDELYFYIEAFDNRTPRANKARTETYFVAIQDTTTQEAIADEGLGVDLMPEYFRSQRQIIIDTEKLLAEKKKIKKEAFNFTSNELGYDQKVLRLRYGQFLGEEFETAIARVDETEVESDEDVTKQFGHQHDTENEHNLVADKKKEPEESHEHEGDGKENPFEAFVHSHDNAEEATFFIQSIKAKLRAALTLMWDSELYLRMYQPAQSLCYQYKILKLLKEISNDSRIYVHRTGFDPPPLKEEKRLTGDLSEIKNTALQKNPIDIESYPSIRNAIRILSEQTLADRALSTQEKSTLRKAGNELATLAQETPGVYLKTLSQIRMLVEEPLQPSERIALQKQVLSLLWKVLPNSSTSPSKSAAAHHSWDDLFLRELKTSEPK